MNKSITKSLLITPLLTACITTSDRSIPLSNSFIQEAELIKISAPSWRIPDSVFNLKISDYLIQNSDITWRSHEQKLIDRNKEYSFINYLLFDDDLSFITEKYEVNGTQRFSFDLTKEGAIKNTAKCELFALFLETNKTSDRWTDTKATRSSAFEDRLKTQLICSINNQEKQWQLTLHANKEEKLIVKLKNEQQHFVITEISESIDIAGKAPNIQIRNIPTWLSKKSGLSLSYNHKQIAAHSFVGESKFWLNKDISPDMRELLLTVNYSLTLFNWLDSDWRN